jgi:phage-related baseplate assembly protein
MSAIDLSSLPAPTVIETPDFEAILADLKADFVSRYPAGAAVIDLESEPVVKLLEVAAYRETLLRARYNDEARALLLAYAVGTDLDHLGASYYQEARLVITPANPAAIPPVAEVLESDADYRTRLALKPGSYSVAGPTAAYRWHALSASGNVRDASVTSPVPGTTTVYILSRLGDGTPDLDLLNAVYDALNDDEVRPLSELVVVEAPAFIDYAIEVELTVYPGAAGVAALSAAADALAALAEDGRRLGHDITLSALTAAAQQPGVKRNAIVLPAADVNCTIGQVPRCTGITVSVFATEP